jgi:hypothetical protein
MILALLHMIMTQKYPGENWAMTASSKIHPILHRLTLNFQEVCMPENLPSRRQFMLLEGMCFSGHACRGSQINMQSSFFSYGKQTVLVHNIEVWAGIHPTYMDHTLNAALCFAIKS